MLFLGSLASLPLMKHDPLSALEVKTWLAWQIQPHFLGYRQMLLYHSLLDAPALKQIQFQHNRGKLELYII